MFLENKKIWYTLHTCPDSQKWPNVLLCELLFSLPIATSRVEQTFSIVTVVKAKRRTSLHTSTLCDLLEICVEGPPLSSFSANGAVNLWWHDSNTTRRVKINNHVNNITQEPRLCRQVRVQNLTKNQTLTQKVVPLYKTGTSGSMNLNINKIVLLLKT